MLVVFWDYLDWYLVGKRPYSNALYDYFCMLVPRRSGLISASSTNSTGGIF